jgi:hypothetical protein
VVTDNCVVASVVVELMLRGEIIRCRAAGGIFGTWGGGGWEKLLDEKLYRLQYHATAR